MICAYSERISCSTAQPPAIGGAGGAGSGEVPRYSEIFVESIATIISMMNGTLMSRVARPLISRRPPPISSTAIAGASTSGIGMPSFVKRPTPWFAYANFSRPSQKKTPPAISRKASVAGAGRRRVEEESNGFVKLHGWSPLLGTAPLVVPTQRGTRETVPCEPLGNLLVASDVGHGSGGEVGSLGGARRSR